VNDVKVDGENLLPLDWGWYSVEHFLITGGARGMVTSSQNVEDLEGRITADTYHV
jgi:hypothetical protein